MCLSLCVYKVPFIDSLILFLSRLFKSTTAQRRSRHSMDAVSEFHAEAPQATESEGLAQGLYVADRAGFEPTTLWTKGDESTSKPPRPAAVVSTCCCFCFHVSVCVSMPLSLFVSIFVSILCEASLPLSLIPPLWLYISLSLSLSLRK